MSDRPPPLSPDRFDYIVVGAGSAGCLLANRLSRDPETRVLLLEAGRKDNHPWIHIPVGYLYCIGNPRMDWLYSTEPEAGLNGRSLRYPRGKSLGGCSSINGMIYMRGQMRDYEAWREATGDAAWAWDSVLPDFMAHEDHHHRLDDGTDPATGGDSLFSDTHGHGGEWRIEKQRLRWEILDAFAEAAVEAGVPQSEDFSNSDEASVGYFEVSQKSGWRWNTSKAFLRPAKGPLGLQAQAVARHHPDHPLDRAGGDQGGCGDDGQQALAPARGDSRQNIAHAVELVSRHGLNEAGDLGLVGAERAVLGQARLRNEVGLDLMTPPRADVNPPSNRVDRGKS